MTVYCLCWYMVNVIFSYFLLSPPRRMVVLTCASGRFIQGSELASYSCESARARRRPLTVDPRHCARRGAAWPYMDDQRGRSLVSEAS